MTLDPAALAGWAAIMSSDLTGPDLPALAELADRPAWMKDALCREPAYADVSFFIELGEDSRPAKAVCGRCLVRRECREYAVAEGIWGGIWGGTSPGERKRLRRSPVGESEAA